jgi:hypothetical protein
VLVGRRREETEKKGIFCWGTNLGSNLGVFLVLQVLLFYPGPDFIFVQHRSRPKRYMCFRTSKYKSNMGFRTSKYKSMRPTNDNNKK